MQRSDSFASDSATNQSIIYILSCFAYILLCLFVFVSLIYISWRLITLQYCSGFCHTLIWISHGFTCGPHPEPLSHLPPHLIPLGHPSAPALSTLSHALNLDWRSVSHMIIHMFQCYSLRPSHPRLLPQSPKDYTSVPPLLSHIWVIVTIFLNYISMCYYTVLVPFFWLTSIYIIGSSFIHLIRTDSYVLLLMAE